MYLTVHFQQFLFFVSLTTLYWQFTFCKSCWPQNLNIAKIFSYLGPKIAKKFKLQKYCVKCASFCLLEKRGMSQSRGKSVYLLELPVIQCSQFNWLALAQLLGTIYQYLSVMYFQTCLFCGHLCLSYALAFIVSLAFESPMMGLEKALLGRKKNT